MRYRWNTGSFAWLVHRLTGIILSLYLIAHIYVLSHLKDPVAYNNIMALMKNPVIKIGELILFAIVLKHVFAGIRITLLEMGVSTKYQKPMAYVGALLVFIVWLAGAFYFLREVF
ncbi:succinate dehydrogenase, cytochrome b556 subunit [Thermodesulfovibrio yellowstonii]|uniref:Succinate dehydrogenase cytochrome b556 subunit n=1 Tax=Thermodesulfovibrio yellowstonii TaxID=28262 RepID=A0A9W6LKM9_9BACT|nr:succinate dehydrogenase, cytochrome b556 subunit [Thermodesulfovibrio islandicus]GLI53837.1 succinate dehydrogenase, cytochrome b556 subunit [Thermodesulfovibrio islandicus]